MSKTFLNIDLLRQCSILCLNIFKNYLLVITANMFLVPERPELNSTSDSNNTRRHTCTHSHTHQLDWAKNNQCARYMKYFTDNVQDAVNNKA